MKTDSILNGMAALIIASLAVGINASILVHDYKSKHPQSFKVIDQKTITVAERAPLVYLTTEHQWFRVGRTLTSQENETLILWDSTTVPECWIVGIVSDSSAIEYIKPGER